MAYEYKKFSRVLAANDRSKVLVKADEVAVDYKEQLDALGSYEFVCSKNLEQYLSELVKTTTLNEFIKPYALKSYVDEQIAKSVTGGEINLDGYAKLEDLSKYMLNTHPAAAITSNQILEWDSSILKLDQLTDKVNDLENAPSGSGISNIVVSLNGSSIQATIQDNTATINLPSLQTEESDPIFTAQLENLVTVSNIREKGSAYFAEVSDVNALTQKVAEFADALANASSNDQAIANLSTKVNNLSDDVKELSDKVNEMIMIEVCTQKEYDDLGDGIKTDVLYLISE